MHKKIESNTGMSFFGVKFSAGGSWEERGKRGTSHLMEHLMCKTYEHLWPKLRELGLNDNAYTTDSSVVFFCSGLDECVEQISQPILDALTKQENIWTEEQFEKEKMIVLQEYGDAFNDQMGGAEENIFRKHYDYCGSIGFRKDIENFTYDDSLCAAKGVFSKPSMIVESGGFNVKYSGLFSNSSMTRKAIFGDYDIETEFVPRDEQTVVCLLSKKSVPLNNDSLLYLTSSCLFGGLTAPFFHELREKHGLVYGVFYWFRTIGNSLVPCILMQTKKQNKEKVVNVCRDFLSKDMRDVVKEDRFNICKNSVFYEKKEADLLPHTSVWETVLNDWNPYDGVEKMNYDMVVDYANKVYNIDHLEVLCY